MDYNAIFTAYYNLYRSEATVPAGEGVAEASWDDEYIIAMRLANEALNRWANYDGTYWNVLFDTAQRNGGGTQTITTSQTAYLAPANFQEAGGYVKIKDSNGNSVQSYGILEPQEAQFRDDNSNYCYFTRGQNYYTTGTASQTLTTVTGSGTTFTSAMVGMQIVWATGESATITEFGSTTSLTVGTSQTVASGAYRIINDKYTLNLNPAPPSSLSGLDIDYVYYKKYTEYTAGDSISEVPDPYFVIHRMLANRFRASRNPYYSSALRDGENALKQMQIDNNSGSFANPWSLTDNSGSSWGA